MARYTGPVCRKCRREGMKLYLKGYRCDTVKCPVERKKSIPGGAPQRRKNLSEYGIQLREKQKVRNHYGLLEKQFKNYYKAADKHEGPTGANLLIMLERRLDNAVYRLGLASSRAAARQLVRHNKVVIKHVSAEGEEPKDFKRVNIPSYLVRKGDEIKVVDNFKENPFLNESLKKQESQSVKSWLSLDSENVVGKVVDLPAYDDIDIEINENLIVELYSR